MQSEDTPMSGTCSPHSISRGIQYPCMQIRFFWLTVHTEDQMASDSCLLVKLSCPTFANRLVA